MQIPEGLIKSGVIFNPFNKGRHVQPAVDNHFCQRDQLAIDLNSGVFFILGENITGQAEAH